MAVSDPGLSLLIMTLNLFDILGGIWLVILPGSLSDMEQNIREVWRKEARGDDEHDTESSGT